MEKKKEFYKWIRIAGFISFIPLVLISGPVGGYFIGDYLTRKFNLGPNVTLIATVIGLLASLIETVRIIRVVAKVE